VTLSPVGSRCPEEIHYIWCIFPAPLWAPLSMGRQVLAGACSIAGFPRGHSLLQTSTCSGMGSLPWAASGYLLTVDLHGLQGTASLAMVCTTGCRGISAPAPGAPPPPPPSLTLVSAELFLSRLNPLSTAVFAAVFPPFLSMLSQRHYQHC